MWGLGAGDSMQRPLGTFPVHREKSGAQEAAGLGTLSKPAETLSARGRLCPVAPQLTLQSPLNVHPAEGRVRFCPDPWDLQTAADVA